MADEDAIDLTVTIGSSAAWSNGVPRVQFTRRGLLKINTRGASTGHPTLIISPDDWHKLSAAVDEFLSEFEATA